MLDLHSDDVKYKISKDSFMVVRGNNHGMLDLMQAKLSMGMGNAVEKDDTTKICHKGIASLL